MVVKHGPLMAVFGGGVGNMENTAEKWVNYLRFQRKLRLCSASNRGSASLGMNRLELRHPFEVPGDAHQRPFTLHLLKSS